MKRKEYEKELEPLQVELNQVARWLEHTGKRLVVLFEGRDTAGKGGTINAIAQDTDGTLTADDAGLSWAVSKKKTDFVGIRGMKRPDLVKEGRKQLVGIFTRDPNEVLEEGAQIVANPNQPKPMTMLGHVTSSYWSENLGRSIAIAMVAAGRARMGETLYVPMKDKTIAVEVTDMVFFDKEGGRIHG